MEIWKDVDGYEGLYQVSNEGRVRSVRTNKILRPHVGTYGYAYVVFSVNQVRKTLKVHRLVALAFVPNQYNKPQVNHKDTNKLNNNASNLEWTTPLENTRHAIRNGLYYHQDGELNHQHKLTKTDVQTIRKMWSDPDRTCTLDSLGELFGVCGSAISMAIRGITWKTI